MAARVEPALGISGYLVAPEILRVLHGCSSFASRSQCRSHRHPPQREGRPQSRSGAGGSDRDRGWCRRHHRASARGPPSHPRRRHGAAQGGTLQAAELRDGRDRRHAGDRACDQASCRLPGARAPRRAHHRGRPRRGRTAQHAAAVHRPAERGRRAGVAVHLGRAAADRDGREAARSGDRDPHRRLVRCRGRWSGRKGGSGMAADRRWQPAGARRRPRGPCRPRARLCDGRADRRPGRDRRIEHRLLHDRGGAVCRARRNGAHHAGRHGPRAAEARDPAGRP